MNENIKNVAYRDLTLAVEEELKRLGAEMFAFSTIMIGGRESYSLSPFPPVSRGRLKNGFNIADFGVRYKGYCSDITVPFFIGRMNKKHKKIINTVEKAYELGFSLLSPGEYTWKIYERVREFVQSRGFDLKHDLGHGLGLTINDMPLIYGRSEYNKEWKLHKNMVFALEVGIYIDNLGGWRVENEILLKNKPKSMTNVGPIILENK